MLILARKPGETIVIQGNIVVTVLEADRRGVRIGIEAPPEVNIVRGEIVKEVTDENARAGAAAAGSEWTELLKGET